VANIYYVIKIQQCGNTEDTLILSCGIRSNYRSSNGFILELTSKSSPEGVEGEFCAFSLVHASKCFGLIAYAVLG
jgi:hypothetical protein